MDQYDDVECKLAICVLHDAAIIMLLQNLDSSEKTTMLFLHPGSSDHTKGGTHVCDTALRLAEAMLIVHAVANIVKLFVQTLLLQTIPFLDSEFVAGL